LAMGSGNFGPGVSCFLLFWRYPQSSQPSTQCPRTTSGHPCTRTLSAAAKVDLNEWAGRFPIGWEEPVVCPKFTPGRLVLLVTLVLGLIGAGSTPI